MAFNHLYVVSLDNANATPDINSPYGATYRFRSNGIATAQTRDISQSPPLTEFWFATGTRGGVITWNLQGMLGTTGFTPGNVNSIFGRTGNIVPQSGDYNAGQISTTPFGNFPATNQNSLNQEIANALGHTNNFVGKTVFGNNTPSYSSQVYVQNGDSLLTAIGKLDSGLNAVTGNVGNIDLSTKADKTTQIITPAAGAITGGGDLSANRTLSVNIPGVAALGQPPVDGDRFLIHSTQANALRTVTLAELLNNISSGLSYQGSWNPSTNTPTLNDSDAVSNGTYYKSSGSGTVNLGSGDISFNEGDWLIHNGDRWEKLSQTEQVSSVFGRIGAVVAGNGDYNAGQITVNASAFNNNLTASDDTVQKVAAKVDALDLTQRSITYNTTSQTGAIAVAVDTFYMNCNPNGSHDYTFPTASEGDLIGFRIRGTSDVIIPRFVGIIEGNENVFVDSDGDYTFVYAGGQWVATLGGVNYVY
jgi:hypothetical protein